MTKRFTPTSPATREEQKVFQNSPAWREEDSVVYDPKTAFLKDALQLAQEKLIHR